MYGLNSDFEHRKVVIYARVSTEHEAQLSALENQVDWYKPILAARPEWELVDQYIDEGITGTSAEKRPRFMKMIQDAKEKKFNMVITREVSRFARNTVDTLQYTRKLKEYGCEVYFINDNIKTFDGDGELRLTIMATLAQDESRKTSIRVKAGQQTSMENGVFYGNGNILGYDRISKNEFVINEEQAKTVRMIYDMYLNGMGVIPIGYELEKRGRLTSTGKERWHGAYIAKMLKNSFYCGLITYHKEYTPDYLKQKKIKNDGDIELVVVKGTHTPIVTEEEYDKVLEIMKQRTKTYPATNRTSKAHVGYKGHSTVWGKLMVCKCGNRFNVKYHYGKAGRHEGTDYQCYTAVNLGSVAERTKLGLPTDRTCDSPFLPGWKLDLMAKHILSEFVQNKENTVLQAQRLIQKHINDKEEVKDNSDVISRKQNEIENLNRKRNNLLIMREEGDIDKEYFRARKAEIESQIEKLTSDIKKLLPEETINSEEDYSDALIRLQEKIAAFSDFGTNISESVIEAFIEKIWVSKDEIRWYLRTGVKRDKDKIMENRLQIGSFTIKIDEAKAFQYAKSTKKRIYNWFDLNVTVWL